MICTQPGGVPVAAKDAAPVTPMPVVGWRDNLVTPPDKNYSRNTSTSKRTKRTSGSGPGENDEIDHSKAGIVFES